RAQPGASGHREESKVFAVPQERSGGPPEEGGRREPPARSGDEAAGRTDRRGTTEAGDGERSEGALAGSSALPGPGGAVVGVRPELAGTAIRPAGERSAAEGRGAHEEHGPADAGP